jgi:hypothetical protein
MSAFQSSTRLKIMEEVYEFRNKLLRAKYNLNFENVFKLYVVFGNSAIAIDWLSAFVSKGKKGDDVVDKIIDWYEYFDDPELASELSKKYQDPEYAYEEYEEMARKSSEKVYTSSRRRF